MTAMPIKRLLLLVALIAMFLRCASIQTLPVPATERAATLENELKTLAHQWMDAAARHDRAALEQLMATDFVLVGTARGTVTPRERWLQNLARIETSSFQYENMRVSWHGANVATVSSRLIIDATVDGKPYSVPVSGVVDVWEKRGAHWQVVTRYAVRPEDLATQGKRERTSR